MRVRMTWPQYKRLECRVGSKVITLIERDMRMLLLLMVRYPNPVSLDEIAVLLFHPNSNLNATRLAAQGRLKQLRVKLGGDRVTIGNHDIGWQVSRDATRRSHYGG